MAPSRFVLNAALALLAAGSVIACSNVSNDPDDPGPTSSGAGATGGGGASSASSTPASASSASSAMGSGGGMSSASGGAGGDAGAAGGGVATFVLDPQTLQVFTLPINSIRYGVGGHDQASDTCVTLIWFAGPGEQICAGSSSSSWPYVILTPNAQAPCADWNYAGNVMVDEASGCVEFFDTVPLSASVDMSVAISGPALSATVVVDNVP